MRTVQQIKMAHDQDLFVRELPKWQAERRQREGRKYPDNLIYMPRRDPRMMRQEPKKNRPQNRTDGTFAFLFIAIAVLVVCAILSV